MGNFIFLCLPRKILFQFVLTFRIGLMGLC